ncbi:MAG: catalase family protein [Mycobacterium sp.]|uniref:catalase family protein n=1 Tax=Mycobacterium sp. TaxID=1785 RepID=UPI00260265DD|nr:catalase family protein [Mycobacterium sp.]MDI3314655.1 catalase family protein [Mycobacterium sp.]
MTDSGRQPSPAYVRYSPKLERPGAHEEETIQKIIEILHRNNEWTFKKFKHGMRDAHAKSHAVLEGELVVEPGLPAHLRQGLFATPATYPVIARISSTQPTLHSDQIRGVRAIAIKVLGVPGPRAQDDGFTTQDFVMVDSPEFPFANARDYLWVGMPIAYVLTRMPDWALKLLTEALATLVGVTEAVSPVPSRLVPIPYFGKAVKLVKLFTTPNYHVLGLTFNTASALRYGTYVAKISVRPLSESVTRLQGKRIPPGSGDDAHRILIADFFRSHDAEYEVCAQLCTDADAIEDATREWSTSPPPQRVAKLIFRRQNSDCYCRRVYADDLLSFNSWRTLEAHRPLGSINRLKAKVYPASSGFRHDKNNAPQIEPSNISELPSCSSCR